jgi:hypothetical protein
VTTIPDGTDLVFDAVNELREQRMMMVQSEVQYKFIYSFLREWFESPTWPTWVGTRHTQEPLIEPSAITSSSIDTGAGEHQAQPGKKRSPVTDDSPAIEIKLRRRCCPDLRNANPQDLQWAEPNVVRTMRMCSRLCLRFVAYEYRPMPT